jgi:hypothetical protein
MTFDPLMASTRDAAARVDAENRSYSTDADFVAPTVTGRVPGHVMPLSATTPFASSKAPLAQRLGKALGIFKFALEPMEKAQAATRVGILTAFGRYDPDEFSKRFDAAMDGKLKLPNREFMELLIGKATHDELSQGGPELPKWMATFIAPEWSRAGKSSPRPRLNVGTMLDFSADFWADPFAIAMMTPAAGALEATRVGRALAAPYRVLTSPLEKWFGPGSMLGVGTLLREPVAVFTGKARPIFDGLWRGSDAATKAIDHKMQAFVGDLTSAGVEKVLKNKDSSRRIAAALHGIGMQDLLGAPAQRALTPDEQTVFGILAKHTNSEWNELISKGIVKGSDVNMPHSFQNIIPRLIGRGHIPKDVLQSWQLKDAQNIWLPHTKDARAALEGAKYESLDALETFKSFVHASKRKQHIEPELARWLPKEHANVVRTQEELVKARIMGGEDAVTAELGPWQRRYLINLGNEFTGHGRGRTAIQFDIEVGRFWDTMLQTPMGKRVEGLMRLTGHKSNLDGLMDFSPTTKISAAMTHNIFRATVGGNMSSWVLNLSQLSSAPIAEGIPAAIRGMLKFGDPLIRAERKNANLLSDYKILFDDTQWMRTVGQKYDDVIFKGFNTAEAMIRGFSFNIGMDGYMRKVGAKSVEALRTRGLLEKAVEHAHLKSIESSFIYGTLGRSPMLANPLLRPTTALISFPFKQAEFYHQAFKRDATAIARFVGLHGWLIEQSNKHMGIAGEQMYGWGFLPQTRSLGGIPLVESPPVKLLLDTFEGLHAMAQGDARTRDAAFKRAVQSLPVALGMNPAPWTEIMDFKKMVERVATKHQKIGEGYVPISTLDTVRSYAVGRTTTQQARFKLIADEERAKRNIYHELDARTSMFVNALTAKERKGNDVVEASRRMAQPVWVDGQPYWPEWDQYNTRINQRFDVKRVSKDVRSLGELGILQQLFWKQHLDLLNSTYQ